MYRTLELGKAGTDEWLAASSNMMLLNNSFSDLTNFIGQPAVELFTRDAFGSGTQKSRRKMRVLGKVQKTRRTSATRQN